MPAKAPAANNSRAKKPTASAKTVAPSIQPATKLGKAVSIAKPPKASRGAKVAAPPKAKPLGLADYLQKILTTRVYDVAIESELVRANNLSRRLGHEVYIKREDTQPVFSFKLRGAYNKMAQLSAKALAKGVICASAGNHAQGVALGARRLGCKATIVMPVTTPQVKVDAVAAFGGDNVQIVLYGESYSDAALHARALEQKKGMTFVHPFDDPDVIAGQGTVAMEILRQHSGPIDAVFVAIGGGGLISGVAAYIKAVRPEIKVIGVQTDDSDAMARSAKAGKRVTLADVGLFADGTAVKLVGEETLRLVRKHVDDFVIVNTDAVCAAIKDIYQDTRSIVEPSGAMGVAAMKQYAARHGGQGKTYIAINCGANMNFDRLRFVAERAEVGEEREALFAVTIPEERGSFKRFCAMIGPRSVTEFNYRISDEREAHVFVGLSTQRKGESKQIAKDFEAQGFATVDLTHDELAKTHVRHMVGGRSSLADGERLFSFEFPERPGALMKFLSTLPPGWNISLFHYRNQGADYGRILMGLQVPPADAKRVTKVLDGMGYRYTDESRNPVYRLFLR